MGKKQDIRNLDAVCVNLVRRVDDLQRELTDYKNAIRRMSRRLESLEREAAE